MVPRVQDAAAIARKLALEESPDSLWNALACTHIRKEVDEWIPFLKPPGATQFKDMRNAFEHLDRMLDFN